MAGGPAGHPNAMKLDEAARAIRAWVEALPKDWGVTLDELGWSVSPKREYPLFLFGMTQEEGWRWFVEQMQLPL